MEMRKEKVVILAGGKGTRLSEETVGRPKPMVEIGGKPILWHIMKIYHQHGFRDFVLCLGYKSSMIKEFFYHYSMFNSDITVETREGTIIAHNADVEDWRITLVDTGEETQTGGRLKRVGNYVKDDEFFCFTYGDGVSDINISETVKFHKSHGKYATISGVRPAARFGALHMENGLVTRFQEKPDNEGGYINGGFFVLSPKVLDYIEGDSMPWEAAPLEGVARDKQLAAYTHDGFWQPMDTLRDKTHLQEMWDAGKAPWKIW
ncbi:MAG TPA: glucose-1-phosphate cytidylyltransferase [Rickettsiales bacterium]|nr:glucose-1-phosphate cytidylyltransferase [Rickettsiales bacterium]